MLYGVLAEVLKEGPYFIFTFQHECTATKRIYHLSMRFGKPVIETLNKLQLKDNMVWALPELVFHHLPYLIQQLSFSLGETNNSSLYLIGLSDGKVLLEE
jgi:hypothetical protein